MTSPKDLRAEPRKVLRCSARIVVNNATQIKGRTIDISMGGISVMLDEPFAVPQQCSIAFDAQVGGKVVNVNVVAKSTYCTCVGTSGFRVGFQFDQKNEATAKAIRQVMQ
jgi:c-di-GMP-binding flagellar brake protein YcgR